MSEIANITRLLLDKDEANRDIGAYTAVGLGSAEQILEHLERELQERRKIKVFKDGSTRRRSHNIGTINTAIWTLKIALGKKIYLR